MKIGDKVQYFDQTLQAGIGEIKALANDSFDHVWIVFEDGKAGWFHAENLDHIIPVLD